MLWYVRIKWIVTLRIIIDSFFQDENLKLTDCYFEKKDWRACKREVSICLVSHLLPCRTYEFDMIQMEVFKECWKRNGNDQRTQSKDG